MEKILISVLFLLSFVLVVPQDATSGVTFICGKAPSGSGCTTDSQDGSTCDASATVYSFTADAMGSSFTVSSAGELSAISIWIGYTTGGEIEIRWGTAADLSSYEASETVSVGAGDDDTWKKITFTTKGSVATATTYYWAVVENSGDVRTIGGTTGPCADAARQEGTGWNLDTPKTSDVKHKIWLCD